MGLVAAHGHGTNSGAPVGGEGHLALLDAANVVHEQLVVTLDLVHRLAAAHGARDVVPPVWRVLVVHRQRLLEQLVLLLRPLRRSHRHGCHLLCIKMLTTE
jgi:hypothetical protein